MSAPPSLAGTNVPSSTSIGGWGGEASTRTDDVATGSAAFPTASTATTSAQTTSPSLSKSCRPLNVCDMTSPAAVTFTVATRAGVSGFRSSDTRKWSKPAVSLPPSVNSSHVTWKKLR